MPRPRPMVSFAQNLEDVILDRVFADVEHGFYVDVGANDPLVYSLTRHFYEHGWRGINIEPGSVYSKLAEVRTRDVNLQVVASNTSGTVTFHEFPAAHGLSTVEVPPDLPTHQRLGQISREVEVRPLWDIFAEYQPEEIHFLSVDVEGHERSVLLGNDWKRYRPRVVVVEAILPGKPILAHESWEYILLEADYVFAYFDGVNRYYVRNEDRGLLERFAAPPNVFDGYVSAHASEMFQDLVRILRDRQEHTERLYQEALARVQDEVKVLRRGTSERTLRIGLWLARQMHRLGHGPAQVRRLFGGSRRAAA